MITINNLKKRARVWLYDSIFTVSDDRVIFDPTSDRFMINSSNIDPDR